MKGERRCYPSFKETPRSLFAQKQWAHGVWVWRTAHQWGSRVGRTGGAVCSGCTVLGWGVFFGRTAFEYSSFLWVLRTCALTLRMLSYRLVFSCVCQLFGTNLKTFTVFAYFIYPPPSNLKSLRTSVKILRSREFFSDFLGACCLLNFARRLAHGALRTNFLLLGSFQLGGLQKNFN